MFQKLKDQKMALYCCQRAIRARMIAKTWKCAQIGKYKKQFEEQIAEAEANIGSAVAAREKVQAAYDNLASQKSELNLALASGGSAVQDIIDKTLRIEGMAAD